MDKKPLGMQSRCNQPVEGEVVEKTEWEKENEHGFGGVLFICSDWFEYIWDV